MKKFKICIVDLFGNDEVVYEKIVEAKNLVEAENIAWKWSEEVEANEGWSAGWMAEEI